MINFDFFLWYCVRIPFLQLIKLIFLVFYIDFKHTSFLSKCMHDKLKKIKNPYFLVCTCTKRTGLVSYRGCNYSPPRSARGHFRTIPFHYLINMKRLKLARFQDLHANTDSNITRLTHFYFLQKRGRGQRWKSWINCVFNNAIINVCMNTIKIKTNICFSFFIFYFVSLH